MTLEEKAIEYVLKTYYVKDLSEEEKNVLRGEIKVNDKRKIKAFISGYNECKADKEKEIEELTKENNILINGLGCKTCSIHLEFERLNTEIEQLRADLEHHKQAN